MKKISELSIRFSRLKRSRQLLVGGSALIVLIAFFGLLSAIFIGLRKQSPSITATPQKMDNVSLDTPTPAITTTAIPFSTATSFGPSQTPLPTGLPTQGLETATIVVLPTNQPPTSANEIRVVITAVDKKLEYVDIQNVGGLPVDLKGWKLVSEVGNQSCVLRGILQSREVLRVWAGRDYPTGLSCGFYKKIWIDDRLDPAVLYNAKGQEISRYP